MEFEFLGEVSGKSEKPSTTKPNDSGIEFEFLDEVTEQPSGLLRQAADIPIQFAKGVGSAVRGYTDLFGADNEVSKSIAGYEDYMDSILSAESKKDSKRVSELLQKAKDGGFLDKVAAGFEAFASAPAEMTANTLGYMVPQLVFGVAGKAAQLSKAAQVGLTIGTGFAQGVGMGKGNIYQGTKDYLREQGVPEDQIEPIASRAQAYNGKNLDQLLLSGGLNALAASTGAEAILTRVLSKQGKDVGEDIIKGILKGAGAEAPIEGVQSAQEAIAPNIALQREGFNVPTFQGAIESATTGIVAGGLIGGAAGAIEAASPEQKALTDIEKEANRRMRDLESDNPAAQALSTEITRLERGIDNKRQDLDALESTSPEANSLRLDIAADQKKLATLKTEAAKFGLSETITTIEEQQAALAKTITAPAEPKPLPTDVLPTETLGATYGREEQVYDVFGEITRKPVSIPKPAELPAAPTIEEQTAEGTYGGQTGVFDVFAGARRKPVVTEQAAPAEAPAPEIAPIAEPTVKISRGENFSMDGEYNVSIGDKKYRIFKDSESGYWYDAGVREDAVTQGKAIQGMPWLGLLSTETRKDAIAELVNKYKKEPITPAVSETITEPVSVENVVGKKVTDSMGALPQKATKAREALQGYTPIFKIGDFYEFIGEEAGLSGSTVVGTGKSARSSLPYHQVSKLQEIANKTGKPIAIIANTKVAEVITPAVSETITEPVTPTEVKTTTEPTKTSPVASTSKAAGDVVNEIERVVDIKGVRAAKQIFDKVIQTLESLVEESKASAGFQTVEFRPSAQKKYGLGTIFIDGEYVASVGKYGDVRPNEEYELKKELPSSFDIRDLSPAKLKQSIELGVASKIARRNNKNQKYIVHIPGDGTFKIESNPIAVAEVVRRIKTNGPSAWKGIYEPKLGEKGGVLIPTKEDFIQAGQNIYEAGMEFGAWAKQMIQRFGDAVREFLGEVWQAVSGAPAKLNELMGYLPKKGEAGAVNVGKGKIGEKAKAAEKPAEPTPEQPTPTPEKPTKPVTEAPSAARKKIMGEEIGELKDTPKNIIAKTKALLRERVFDPTKVTEQNTIEAFRALGKLTGNKQERRDFADELNDIAAIVEDTGAASEVSMGAALFVNDLFEYAVRLAAEGQKMMLGIMMTNINRLPTGTEGRSDAGRALRAAREMKDTFLTMAQAEQDAFINYAAEFVYGPNPTKEQVDSIQIGYDAVEKVEEPTAEELTDELDEVGKKTGTDLVAKIEDEIAQATSPTKDPIVSTILTLQKLYGGTIETRYLEARESAQKIKEGVKKILTGGITNYRGKMVEGAASGLESGFWKTLANTENKPGPLGELDNAQNRELGSIVKSMLISLGLKGTPPNTKMDIYEQVASILGEKPLSNDKIKLADEKIRDEINRKREKELSETEDQDAQDAINLKYNGIENAWDQSMARQLDIPISDAMLRRLIFNELKEEKTSITDLAKLMNEEPVIGSSRQDRLVNSIISKIAGVTFEGQNPADYSALKEYLGNQLESLIQEKQLKSNAAKAKAQLAKDAKGSVELQAEKAENEAQSQIERLAKIQSDTPSFPGEAQMNPVHEAVKNALKLNLNRMFDPSQSAEIISNFKKSFVKELMGFGVKEQPATILADVVGRQIEINSLNNQLKSIDRAIEKGSISEIVKAIKDTPLEEQQKPNWRYEVMRDYLRKAGLNVAQSERIAKLMDISLQKRFTQAKEQAFTDAVSKTAPWKDGNVRSKRAFQQVLQAIRSGALDPSRNMASDIAALNGWTGFTADQYKNLLKNDTILADPKSSDLEKSEAYKAIQDIISKSKLPIRARDVIGQYYDAQALSGIPTLTVNSFSPIAFAMRNAIIEIGSGTLKGNPKAITNAATAFVDSIKSWANTVAFSFKNNVTVYSNVDYIVNDDNLLRLYRRGVDQFKGGKTPRERADGVKNMMIGMMDYVRRILNALDYGAIASLQNQNISKYAMAVMKNKGMNNKQANEVFAAMMKEKNDFYLNQIAIGTDKNKASILADEYYISSWKKSLEKEGVGAGEIKSAMDAAINDALSSVGRNRQSLDAFKEEATNLKDAGLASSPALWLLESVANAANRSDSQFIKVFSRVIYGFAIVPARVIRETAWFSPYGFVRLAVDKAMRGKNMDSRYAQSLGSDFQRQQRFNEAVAGTVALIALASLRGSSTDEPEEDEFKIVFTGNGPQRKDDAQFYDSWYKAGNKPNSMIVSFGKTKFTLNMMRGFEAFTWPAMMLGAVDDLEIRKKQKRDANTGTQLEDASIVAGFVFDAALRRGPYAFTTKSLFGTYGDIGVEGVAKGLTFPAKTLIPVLGTSLASNLSNFINDPIDRRTLDGAVWSNIPFIGPAVAPKSLNAFGEPSLSTDFASKMFKLGVPIVYDIPTDRESIMLHELVLSKGGGPSIPTRNQLAQRLDRQPTNKEYEMFVKEYGAVLTKSMKKNYEKLSAMKPEAYTKVVERIGNRARDIAENKVRVAAKKP
jgi:hypothetical protein